MTYRLATAVPLLLLEIGTTVATSYQHHSEAKWEISAAFFGTLTGYLLARLMIWLPLSIILLMGAKLLYRPLAVGQAGAIALIVEVSTTLASILLCQKDVLSGIFFGSFATYLGARLLPWIPLAFGSLAVLKRPR